MRLIVVTDIFGKTEPFRNMVSEVAGSSISVEIVDPYEGQEMDFAAEDQAYRCFQRRMGLKNYAAKLYGILHDREATEQQLLGFSVGASALWMVAERLNNFRKTKGICFYRSQIRNCVHLSPNIDVDLYFSKTELTYDVDEIMAALAAKENVRCYKTQYLHGFMNKKSRNYSEKAYGEFTESLKKRFRQ